MRRPTPRTALCALALIAACTRPGEDRALADREVGVARIGELAVEITERLAAIRVLAPGQLGLWASAPIVELTLDVPATAAGPWRLTVENALPDAELTEGGAPIGTAVAGPRPTVLIRDVTLTAGRHVLTVAPPPEAPGPFRIVAMADIQTGLPTVDEVFTEIAAVAPRFVVCMGDLTERAELAEYELYEAKLATLPVPIYSTIGNHELWADPARYHARFGRASYQFVYRDVAFTFADSGDAGLDPLVEDEVDAWITRAAERTQLFLTHFPPLDPSGIRDGAFRSRRDAQRLVGKLAAAGVDLALYGHIHSYAAYEHAGIPAFVSGGGGARPELWDGIGRHFLVIDLAANATPTVGVHRVD